MGPDEPGRQAPQVTDRLRRLFEANGPLRFDTYMQAVLYDEGGFYRVAADRAARRGDFVTSVELGPVFADCVARAIWDWTRNGAERDVRVVDAGGGRGTLARGLLDAWQGLGDEVPPLDVVVVEVSEAARDEADGVGLAAVGTLDELPWPPDVVVANELLDNLPCRLLYGTDAELRVGFEDGTLTLFHTPLTRQLGDFRDRWFAGVQVESVVPVPTGALDWAAAVDAVAADDALVLLFDYGEDVRALARREDWPVRAYRGHERVDPFMDPGTADVTCDVPVDVVADSFSSQGWRTGVSRQADWLRGHGIGAMASGARDDEIRAAQEGEPMPRLQARTRRGEISALLDPDGLGGFAVIEARRSTAQRPSPSASHHASSRHAWCEGASEIESSVDWSGKPSPAELLREGREHPRTRREP